jgi:Zn-dependent peptidase ImmA (M78 family)/transcriptional regulator with XRE-family HTH domain
MVMLEPATFHGAKLRVARLLSQLTKAELADRLGVSRQFIHALEVGSKPASGDMLAALSLFLKVTPSFFSERLVSEVREEECHFRSRTSMPTKVAEQVIARGTALEILVRYLDSRLSLPHVDFPSLDASSADGIETAALMCRSHWKLGLGPISNMCRVLENAGAIVTFFSGDRHEIDALSMARVRPIIVRNSHKQSPGRSRFDLAHECGHLIIHQGIETGDEQTEREANEFASAFLMPRDTFSREFPTMPSRVDWQSIFSLKVRWRVSAKAVIRRAYGLGLLNAVLYASANRFLNQSGQSKVERFDERIPAETPELLKMAIDKYLSTFNVFPAELAREVGMTPALVEQLVGVSLRKEQVGGVAVNA